MVVSMAITPPHPLRVIQFAKHGMDRMQVRRPGIAKTIQSLNQCSPFLFKLNPREIPGRKIEFA